MFAKITNIFVVFAIVQLTTSFVSCTAEASSNNRDIEISYPKQFIPSGKKFYFVGTYQVEWADAAGKCHEVGAKFAIIESAAEMKAISDAIYSTGMYVFAANGRESCPIWSPNFGWYHQSQSCTSRNNWICETEEPLDVAHRVWMGAI